MTERKVEMVRVPREEEYFDREAVLGRDATSVFPLEAAAQADASREAMVEALGARKFISETELATIQAARGGTVDDGSVAADKPLAAILQERKAEKDAAFQEKWKQMKTGKNRPLDTEEADFIDHVRRLQAEKDAAARREESAELEAFREAVRAAAAGGGGGGGGGGGAEATATGAEGDGAPEAAAAAPLPQRPAPSVGPAAVLAAKAKPAPLIKPQIKVIPKGKRPAASGSSSGGGVVAAAAAASGGDAKRQRAADGEPQKSGSEDGSDGGGGGGGGLAGLLGGYGSDSD